MSLLTSEPLFISMHRAHRRTVDAPAFQMYRVQDDRPAEHWEVADFATLLPQLD